MKYFKTVRVRFWQYLYPECIPLYQLFAQNALSFTAFDIFRFLELSTILGIFYDNLDEPNYVKNAPSLIVFKIFYFYDFIINILILYDGHGSRIVR